MHPLADCFVFSTTSERSTLVLAPIVSALQTLSERTETLPDCFHLPVGDKFIQ